jgi:hypothetical protein
MLPVNQAGRSAATLQPVEGIVVDSGLPITYT